MGNMNYSYATAFGTFTLKYESQDKSLRPYDAADEYLLNLISKEFELPHKILIVNDRCGALSLPLADQTICHINDSLMELEDTAENLSVHGMKAIPAASVFDSFPRDPDMVVIKIPKSLDHFRFQLEKLKSRIQRDSVIMAAGMSRYLPDSYYSFVSEELQDCSYSRIEKKARYYRGLLKPASLDLALSDKGQTQDRILPPASFDFEGREYRSYPGVFSMSKVDPGSRFLLENMPDLPVPNLIVDPGCGSGVLGLEALQRWPEARLIATDDSAPAIESTRYNARSLGREEQTEVIQTRILRGIPEGSADLVICNPPFHRGHTISMETGIAFIRESAAVLREGGYFALVVNRTLGYSNFLKDKFQRVNILKQNSKYSLILCRK
jgi:23S rRNA (guanine1835-N2)-methyltransferase